MTHRLYRLALAAVAGVLVAGAGSAQTAPAFSTEPDARGTAYFTFAEPGAPTIEVVFLGEGTRSGIYRLQEGTSLIEAVALAGGTARSDSTARQIVTSRVRVLRSIGGTTQLIYQVTPERLPLERDRHPTLQTGDVIETQVEYREVPEPFTFRDGVEVAARVASLVSLVLLLTGLR